jgi:cyclase
MKALQRTCRIAIASLAATCVGASAAGAQHDHGEVVPGFVLYPTPAGNIAGVVATAGVFLVGPVTAQSTAMIQADLASKTQVTARYVIVTAQPSDQSHGDGGWTRLGAFVSMHENAQGRLVGHGPRLAAVGAEVPRSAFSQVLKFFLGGHEVHAVHQRAGYSDADVLVHFENAGVVYLGETLAGDGYPVIDSAQGGTIDGMIQTLNPWAGPGGNRFIGAFGPAMTGTELRAYRDMLVAVRDRVRAAKQAGRSVTDVVASRPTASYDAQFGRGRVTPEAFVRSVYRTAR